MAILAVFLFAGLLWFGQTFFGWTDYNHHIRMALVMAFIMGVLFGWSVSRQK